MFGVRSKLIGVSLLEGKKIIYEFLEILLVA